MKNQIKECIVVSYTVLEVNVNGPRMNKQVPQIGWSMKGRKSTPQQRSCICRCSCLVPSIGDPWQRAACGMPRSACQWPQGRAWSCMLQTAIMVPFERFNLASTESWAVERADKYKNVRHTLLCMLAARAALLDTSEFMFAGPANMQVGKQEMHHRQYRLAQKHLVRLQCEM